LAVRIRLRLRRGGLTREVVALVSSGYDADTPQLLIPVGLARELGLWPPRPDTLETTFETAGGPLRVWVYRRAVEARAVAEGPPPTR